VNGREGNSKSFPHTSTDKTGQTDGIREEELVGGIVSEEIWRILHTHIHTNL